MVFCSALKTDLGQPGSLHLFVEDVDAEQVLDMDRLEIDVIELVLGAGDRSDRLLADVGHESDS